jgi:hypothetical protein
VASRAFPQRDRAPLVVEIDDAVPLGIGDVVGEDRRAGVRRRRLGQRLRQAMAEIEVVAQHQGALVVADERLADDEGVGQAARGFLDRVLEPHPPVRAVAQQVLEQRHVLGRGDDQDVADPRQHQGADRIIDHRLVVDRQQLLADRPGQGVQPRAGSAGENDAFHGD